MKGKVLYIEDESFFGTTLADKLKKSDYEVVLAGDGLEGLAAVHKEKFNIILLDLLLPSMDGFSVLQQLKEDKSTCDIPVIVLSNLDSQDDLNKAKTLGAEVFLVKALTDPKEITDSIDQILAFSEK